ncbi:hypothetical protein Sjap_026609 [Stephania japonica]|uniref:Secreted protein n=1 Tax=Stephania japonica TaxID=461633 RepID=A0AAP0HEA7_9MAGN
MLLRTKLILKPLLLPNVAGVALEFGRDKAAKNAAKKVKRAKTCRQGDKWNKVFSGTVVRERHWSPSPDLMGIPPITGLLGGQETYFFHRELHSSKALKAASVLKRIPQDVRSDRAFG